jgi:hypothetical protein
MTQRFDRSAIKLRRNNDSSHEANRYIDIVTFCCGALRRDEFTLTEMRR